MKQRQKALFLCGCFCCFVFLFVRTPMEKSSSKREIATEAKKKPVFVFPYDIALKSNYTKMPFGPVYVLGAAMGNSSDNETWDVVKLYGMINMSEYEGAKLACCLLFETSELYKEDIVKEQPINIIKFRANAELRGHHVTCLNTRHTYGALPLGAALILNKLKCKRSQVRFVRPYVPLRETDTKLAIGTKLAFGNISAELIIEWMEAYKFLGVDKVVTYYVDEINENALQVLRYYASTKILDLYHHVPAGSDVLPRTYHPPNPQKWNDNQMLIFDSFERMSGYTYFGIIDHDEFLIPSKNRSLKQMLADLFKISDNAAGFVFQTVYYYLSWGASGTQNDMTIGTYIKKAWFPKIDNEKNIYKPKYIAFGGVHTHDITPLPDFEMVIASSYDGYIRHFRECRKINKEKCLNMLNTFRQVVDTSVANWSMRIYKKVQQVRQEIFRSVQPVL